MRQLRSDGWAKLDHGLIRSSSVHIDMYNTSSRFGIDSLF